MFSPKCIQIWDRWAVPMADLIDQATVESVSGTRAGNPSLMFVAGFRHRPNVDAALWLAREILPRLTS